MMARGITPVFSISYYRIKKRYMQVQAKGTESLKLDVVTTIQTTPRTVPMIFKIQINQNLSQKLYKRYNKLQKQTASTVKVTLLIIFQSVKKRVLNSHFSWKGRRRATN